MAPASDDSHRFCDVEWVHAFEQDTRDGATFLPSNAHFPLSRRPRERLVLRRDGSAVIRLGAPDDRTEDHAAAWTMDGDEAVVRTKDGQRTWRIVRYSDARLAVRMD